MSKRSSDSAFQRLATMLSNDFCPGANRWVYWMKNPFWILLMAVLGSALCGVFLNPMAFALTVVLLTVAIVGGVLPWVAMKSVSCHILFDVPRTKVGDAAMVRLRIKNRSVLPIWGLSLIDGFSSSAVENAALESDEGLAFGCVRGRSTVEYSWSFVPRRRGVFPLGDDARIETSFPFGLLRSQRTAEFSGRLIVWPETARLLGLPESVQCESTDDQFSDRRAGEFGDILGTRPYRQGDSLRRVHWAQTARQRDLIVVERQSPVTSVVRVALDLSSGSHPEDTRFETIEQCIRVAGSICESLFLQGCHVELCIGDELYVGSAGTSGLNRVMDALAAANVTTKPATSIGSAAGHRSSGFRAAVTTEYGSRQINNLQVVVTTSPDTPAEQFTNKSGDARLSSQAPLSELVKLWSRSAACLN